MAQEYYPPSGAEPTEQPEREDSEEMSDTALLPKSLFNGECKVGDKYQVEVVAVYDDEIEVKPVSGETSSEPASPEDQLDAMATEQ